MSKGTILYVGNFELPDKGASANRVMANRKIFEALGYEVAMLGVVRDDEFEGVRVSSFDEKVFEESYPTSSVKWFEHMISVKNIRAVAKNFPDLKLIILYNVPYSLLVSVKKAFKNTKVVYDCTEWNPDAEGNIVKRKIKSLDEKLVRTRIGKTADSLIVISRLMEKEYEGKNVLLLPPLVDINDKIWHQEKLSHDGFEFLFAGDINGNKESLDKIVSAVSLVEGATLRIIGVEERAFRTRYPKVSFDNKKIIFMGRLSHTETLQYVLSCDSYIFIRQSDLRNNAGFPTKFAESFTCGAPIVSTDVSNIKDYMSEERGLILSSTDISDIKSAIEKIMNGNFENKGLSASFHYENYIEKTENWLSKI